MAKKRKSSRNNNDLMHFAAGLDMILAGHRQVVGPDFIMRQRDPFDADIGHLNPKDLNTYDQGYIDDLVSLKADNAIAIPVDLETLSNTYMSQRELLSDFHNKAFELLRDYDLDAAQELGNFDKYLDKIVIRNEAETNVFYDYISLYRKLNGARAVKRWIEDNPHAVDKQNRTVVSALEKAKFAILRLDENLPYGGIRVTNIINQKEMLLIDRALNRSRKEGLFFVCSLLDMGEYVMTSGGGIPLDPKVAAGKSALSLSQKHLAQMRKSKLPLTNNTMECVRKIYGLCLRGGALSNMTVN
ncbi:hypothetical protein [Cysteiniphilum litorale]|uniref:hypothetical protein n=1 Tax=Cysteiniphilum litorale TaxID=2056700 RepID=UPI003F882230